MLVPLLLVTVLSAGLSRVKLNFIPRQPRRARATRTISCKNNSRAVAAFPICHFSFIQYCLPGPICYITVPRGTATKWPNDFSRFLRILKSADPHFASKPMRRRTSWAFSVHRMILRLRLGIRCRFCNLQVQRRWVPASAGTTSCVRTQKSIITIQPVISTCHSRPPRRRNPVSCNSRGDREHSH